MRGPAGYAGCNSAGMLTAPLRRGDMIRIRDERWTVWRHVSHAGAAELEVRGCDRGNRGLHARFLLPFETLERLPLSHALQGVTARQCRRRMRHVLADAQPSWDALRTLAAARIEVLPYQLEPALALVRGLAVRVLIADDVGLGKTVQAGLVVAETLERDPRARALIVTPAALRDQWRAELQARFGVEAAALDAASVVRPGLQVAAGSNPWAAHRVILASIDYVKRPEVLRALEALIWDVLVIDEAHGIAGRSDRHAAAAVLSERARALVMLSATPHSGDDEAFARLCGVGDLETAFPLAVFRRTREDAGLPSRRRTRWLAVAPTLAEQAMHRALMAYAQRVWRAKGTPGAARLAMVILARRACSSAASLARSVERRLGLLAPDRVPAGVQMLLPLCEPDGDEEPSGELAAPGLPDADEERRALEEILLLARRAEADESKLRAVRRLLRRAGEPAIVFTEYRDTLATLSAALGGFRVAQLHGDVGAADRREVLREFASGGITVLLATDTASEGLNLQHGCRLVINLELPWTPVRLEQRVGRVDRIGQSRRVHQVLLVAARTSEEEAIAPLLRARARRVHLALEAMRPPALDERDIAAHVFTGCAAGPGNAEPRQALPAPSSPVSTSWNAGTFPVGNGPTLVPDLRDDAAREARRAVRARALAGGVPPVSPPGRPFAAALARRARRSLWVFRLDLGDGREDLLWTTLAGGMYDHVLAKVSDRAAVLSHLEAIRDSVLRAIEPLQDAQLTRASILIAPAVAIATAREQAILRALEARGGLLAAALVQPALFDRRAEREAASRRDALLQMRTHCHEHLARLAQRRHVAGQGIEPAFAVLLP